MNIFAARQRLNAAGYRRVLVSTNIGERQAVRATACQSSLGVATAGADLIKFGLAELTLDAAAYLGQSLVRTVRQWFPKKKLYPAVFVDDEMTRFFDPVVDGPKLARAARADGLLIDTYNKSFGKGLLDFITLQDVKRFTRSMHRQRREAWIAGSITLEELPTLWATGVDVICVRGAACDRNAGAGRFGAVKESLVRELMSTLARRPKPRRTNGR